MDERSGEGIPGGGDNARGILNGEAIASPNDGGGTDGTSSASRTSSNASGKAGGRSA
ncbi:hypothetical protein BDN71DRAFT_1458531 [Pleurotus eryngii]|uniref:Uncharacterized protein n=1 Tax=Pleurotus eryngii TaxID=5323 RepID=A0A9P6D989_PLEER|nr:hypothetical protein BDN71DRAFT_1458531 [Pleurotus eryngii]